MTTIFLIEDDPFLIDVYSAKLKEVGFEVDIATSGEEGIRKIKQKKPDLLLLDIVLPGANGWEIIERIRKDEAIKDLKIVILSNLTEKDEVEKGLWLGADKYLIKAHFTPSQIVEEIKKILSVG